MELRCRRRGNGLQVLDRTLKSGFSDTNRGATEVRVLRERALYSVRARHTKNMLPDVGENEVRRDGSNLIETCFPPLALDLVFLGK